MARIDSMDEEVQKKVDALWVNCSGLRREIMHWNRDGAVARHLRQRHGPYCPATKREPNRILRRSTGLFTTAEGSAALVEMS